MKQLAPLTAGEFELMEILWRVGEASVKQVWEAVDPARGLAYTTVMTVLDKMRRKGLVSQRKQGKAFYYSPAVERGAAIGTVVDQLVRTYFNGSYVELAAFVSRREAPDSDAPAAAVVPAPSAAPIARDDDIDEFLL